MEIEIESVRKSVNSPWYGEQMLIIAYCVSSGEASKPLFDISLTDKATMSFSLVVGALIQMFNYLRFRYQ